MLLGLSVAAVLAAVLVVMGLGPGPSGANTDGQTSSRPTFAADRATPGVAPTDDTPDPTPNADASPAPTPAGTPTPTKQVDPRSVEPSELTGYEWPLRNARVTSRFAPRAFAGFVIIDGKEMHDGLDLATHCGDEVRAAHAGTVLYAGRNFDVYLGYQGRPEQIYARLEQQGRVKTLPIVIVIDDGNGYRSVYVHLSKAKVEAGDVVRAGDIIGAEGMTGLATGCHLHYGLIRMDGGWQQVVPRLARFGYPPLVRERVNPLDVLAWGDEHAPKRLRDRVNPPSPSADPSPLPE